MAFGPLAPGGAKFQYSVKGIQLAQTKAETDGVDCPDPALTLISTSTPAANSEVQLKRVSLAPVVNYMLTSRVLHMQNL